MQAVLDEERKRHAAGTAGLHACIEEMREKLESLQMVTLERERERKREKEREREREREKERERERRRQEMREKMESLRMATCGRG